MLYLFFILLLSLLVANDCNASIQVSNSLKSHDTSTSAMDAGGRKSNCLKIGIISWNMAERSPDFDDCQFLENYLDSDIIALGLQECEDIRPRRKEGRRSRKWRQIREHFLHNGNFRCLCERKMGGVHLSLYTRKSIRNMIKNVQVIKTPCGIGNIIANKGAISMILQLKNLKTIAFINAHLAAHQKKVAVRNANFHRIVSSIEEFLSPKIRSPKTRISNRFSLSRKANKVMGLSSNRKSSRALKSRSLIKQNTTMHDLFDAAFFFGDLNYRIDLPSLQIESFCDNYSYPSCDNDEKDNLYRKYDHYEIDLPKRVPKINNLVFNVPETEVSSFKSKLSKLMKRDQLLREKRRKRAFAEFQEMPIDFPPTYKYDKCSPFFDSKKGRAPAWTDRILYLGPKQSPAGQSLDKSLDSILTPLSYECFDVRSSDHRPIGAKFTVEFFESPVLAPTQNKISSSRRKKNNYKVKDQEKNNSDL